MKIRANFASYGLIIVVFFAAYSPSVRAVSVTGGVSYFVGNGEPFPFTDGETYEFTVPGSLVLGFPAANNSVARAFAFSFVNPNSGVLRGYTEVEVDEEMPASAVALSYGSFTETVRFEIESTVAGITPEVVFRMPIEFEISERGLADVRASIQRCLDELCQSIEYFEIARASVSGVYSEVFTFQPEVSIPIEEGFDYIVNASFNTYSRLSTFDGLPWHREYVDLRNTAVLSVELPDGTRMISDSGTFLTQPVPLPSPLVLLSAALLMVVKYRRSTRYSV